MNFNPLTGFKRPHPGAEEESHRAVRARPESALGQGGSTSGRGEPGGPLPAPGNLSAWVDSLPSFNFPPDVDWETPPASPTESVELSTILSELQGEPAREPDTASAPLRSQNAPVAQQAPQLPRGDEPDAPPSPMEDLSAWADSLLSFNASPDSTEDLPAGSMGAEELFAIQDQPVALQDATTSMSRQGSDANRPAPVFAGEATGVDAAHRGRQSTQSMPGLHRNLLAARERLTAGATFTAAARELNINISTLANTFDRRGRLMINGYGQRLLQSRDAQVARQVQQLPRVFTQADLDKLTQALRANVGREPRQLHTALQHSPNPVAQEALAFLIDAHGLRADRLALLPDVQRQELEAAHQGRPSPLQTPLHRNLLAARQRLAAGATPTAAACELNIPKGTWANTFDRHGHLMINNYGRRLLQSRDEQVARQAQQLPRALTPTDLNKLTQTLRENADREPSQLHTALQNLPNPVAPEALAFLVDAGGLRADRLALLPDVQRQALEAAHQGRQSPLQTPLHRNLLAARQRLAAGATVTAAARELNIVQGTLAHTFDRRGHLMINGYGQSLLQSRDAQVARQARQLPRVLVRADLNKLTRTLRDNAGREPSQLHTALQQAPNPVSREALAFLVDAGGLRADRLALLSDAQRRELEAAWQAFCQRAPT